MSNTLSFRKQKLKNMPNFAFILRTYSPDQNHMIWGSFLFLNHYLWSLNQSQVTAALCCSQYLKWWESWHSTKAVAWITYKRGCFMLSNPHLCRERTVWLTTKKQNNYWVMHNLHFCAPLSHFNMDFFFFSFYIKFSYLTYLIVFH